MKSVDILFEGGGNHFINILYSFRIIVNYYPCKLFHIFMDV